MDLIDIAKDVVEESSFGCGDIVTCSHVIAYLKTQPPSLRRLAAYMEVIYCNCGTFSIDKYTDELELLMPKLSQPENRMASILVCNHYPPSSMYSNNNFIRDMVSTDMVHLFDYSNATIEKVLDRISVLKDTLGILWASYLEARYMSYLDKIFLHAKNADIPHNLLVRCAKVTGIYVVPLSVYDDLVTKDNLQSTMYKLALPVNVAVSPDTVTQKIDEATHNPEAYCKKIQDINDKRLQLFVEEVSLIYPYPIVVNTEDTLFYDVNSYHPNDIVRYCAPGGKIFQFTTPEFKTLIEKGVNFNTNTPLPGTLIDDMKYILEGHLFPDNCLPVSAMLDTLFPKKKPLSELIPQREFPKKPNYDGKIMSFIITSGCNRADYAQFVHTYTQSLIKRKINKAILHKLEAYEAYKEWFWNHYEEICEVTVDTVIEKLSSHWELHDEAFVFDVPGGISCSEIEIDDRYTIVINYPRVGQSYLTGTLTAMRSYLDERNMEQDPRIKIGDSSPGRHGELKVTYCIPCEGEVSSIEYFYLL